MGLTFSETELPPQVPQPKVKATFSPVLIPVPPIPVQQQVIDECAKIDEEYNATRMSIETYRQKIADLFAELDVVMSTIGGGTD